MIYEETKVKPLFYWNDWGPVQKDGDDGDQLHRLGLYYYGLYLRRKYHFSVAEYDFNTLDDYLRFLRMHEIQVGRYIRGKRWNDPLDVSRDQMIPNIIALGAYGCFGRLATLMDQSVHMGFCPNKDFLMPQHWGMVNRCENEKPLWGQDGCLYLDVLSFLGRALNADFCDDINLLLLLIQSEEVHPSQTSKLATRLYGNSRPLSRGSTELNAKNPLLGSMMWYFRQESGACPGFVDLYEPLIDLIFYGKL